MENTHLFLNEFGQRRLTQSARFISKANEEEDLSADQVKERICDIEYLYLVSYSQMNAIFVNRFPDSNAFKQMVLVMNQNLIEYRFLAQSGLIS